MRQTTAVRHVVLGVLATAPGGMETHAIDLAGEYVRRGIRVQAVVPGDATVDSVAQRFAASGAEVHRLGTEARHGRFHQLRDLVRLAWLLRRARPQVVHLHSGRAIGGLAFLTVARLVSGAVVVLSEHDVPRGPFPLRDRIRRRLVDRAAHVVVAVSRRNARIRLEWGGGDSRRMASVLNGVPIPRETPDEAAAQRARVRAELGLGDELVVGSLVRLVEGKGLETLLEAFAIVARRVPGAKLLLAGDGPLRPHLEARANDLGIGGDVVFAGHREDAGAVLHALDVFALAVPAGSMSIALLEAMVRGIPSVITFGGPEEAVVDGVTGLCPPPNDPPALAEALVRLLEEPRLRMQLGLAGRDYVHARFSSTRVADDMLAVYAGARNRSLPSRLSPTAASERPAHAHVARGER